MKKRVRKTRGGFLKWFTKLAGWASFALMLLSVCFVSEYKTPSIIAFVVSAITLIAWVFIADAYKRKESDML